MKFITLKGTSKTITKPYKYRIDWNGECRSIMQETVKVFLSEYWIEDVVFEEFPVATPSNL